MGIILNHKIAVGTIAQMGKHSDFAYFVTSKTPIGIPKLLANRKPETPKATNLKTGKFNAKTATLKPYFVTEEVFTNSHGTETKRVTFTLHLVNNTFEAPRKIYKT